MSDLPIKIKELIMSDLPIKIIVADGAFDGMDQDEVDSILAEIQAMAESGELMERGELVDMNELADEEPEAYRQVLAALAQFDTPTLH